MFRWNLVAVDLLGAEYPVSLFAEDSSEAVKKVQDAFPGPGLKRVRVVSAEEYWEGSNDRENRD